MAKKHGEGQAEKRERDGKEINEFGLLPARKRECKIRATYYERIEWI